MVIVKFRDLLGAQGFSGGSDGEESVCNAGDPSLIPGSGGSPGEGNGNPFQFSCLENPMDRGTWRATICGIAEADMAERLTHSWCPVIEA